MVKVNGVEMNKKEFFAYIMALKKKIQRQREFERKYLGKNIK